MTAPLLVFGWGNPSRGDDALGPLFVERVAAGNFPGVDCLTDFQLQVEHALDLAGRQRVLFVDASLSATAPFEISRLWPARGDRFSTHAVAPEAVMQVYVELHDEPPPACTLLALRGVDFELGAGLSPAASRALDAACEWFARWHADADATPTPVAANPAAAARTATDKA